MSRSVRSTPGSKLGSPLRTRSLSSERPLSPPRSPVKSRQEETQNKTEEEAIVLLALELDDTKFQNFCDNEKVGDFCRRQPQLNTRLNGIKRSKSPTRSFRSLSATKSRESSPTRSLSSLRTRSPSRSTSPLRTRSLSRSASPTRATSPTRSVRQLSPLRSRAVTVLPEPELTGSISEDAKTLSKYPQSDLDDFSRDDAYVREVLASDEFSRSRSASKYGQGSRSPSPVRNHSLTRSRSPLRDHMVSGDGMNHDGYRYRYSRDNGMHHRDGYMSRYASGDNLQYNGYKNRLGDYFAGDGMDGDKHRNYRLRDNNMYDGGYSGKSRDLDWRTLL